MQNRTLRRSRGGKQVRDNEGWGKGYLKDGMVVIEGEKVIEGGSRGRSGKDDAKITL